MARPTDKIFTSPPPTEHIFHVAAGGDVKILSVGLALLNLEPPKHPGQVIPVRRPLKVRPRGAAAWLAVNCGRKGKYREVL